MSLQKVLVVDDDPHILKAVRTSLQALGYEVVSAPNGETALELATASTLDALILDLSLPGIDGHEVVRRIREWSEIPIIILSVQESQADKVTALNAGADDYVTKPFAMGELVARMRAVQRRATPETRRPVLRFGLLEIDLVRQLVAFNSERIKLTPKEYRLLETMARHPGKLLTHRWLLGEVWGPGYESESHYLRVFIRQLRKKLGDDPASPQLITTEPGLGYRWLKEPDAG